MSGPRKRKLNNIEQPNLSTPLSTKITKLKFQPVFSSHDKNRLIYNPELSQKGNYSTNNLTQTMTNSLIKHATNRQHGFKKLSFVPVKMDNNQQSEQQLTPDYILTPKLNSRQQPSVSSWSHAVNNTKQTFVSGNIDSNKHDHEDIDEEHGDESDNFEDIEETNSENENENENENEDISDFEDEKYENDSINDESEDYQENEMDDQIQETPQHKV